MKPLGNFVARLKIYLINEERNMKPDFWIEKWEKNEIGFHLDAPHPWLVRAVSSGSSFKPGQVIFVPLCGKTHDIDFLLQQGCKVVGVEISELAVQALFDRLGYEPRVTDYNTEDKQAIKRYQFGPLTVFVGDYFQLTYAQISDAYEQAASWVYDRAALIALPSEMRSSYSAHLMQLCPKATHLLMTLDYQQEQMQGPPFSVNLDEIKVHYEQYYQISTLYQQDIIEKEPRFKQRGLTEFIQSLYQLTPKSVKSSSEKW